MFLLFYRDKQASIFFKIPFSYIFNRNITSKSHPALCCVEGVPQMAQGFDGIIVCEGIGDGRKPGIRTFANPKFLVRYAAA